MSRKDEEAVVELIIPARPEYVSVARLAILGVASRMPFSYDEVEDVRLAVGEACTSTIERINGAGGANEVRLRCLIDANKLVVEVFDPSPLLPEPVAAGAGMGSMDEPSLGGVLIRILMDDVVTEPHQDGRVVRLVKYVER